MEKQKLQVCLREDMSKSHVKELRRNGKIPGALHGKGKAALPLEVALPDLAVVLRTEAGIHGVFDLSVKGAERGEGGTAVIKSIQTNPINRKLIHIDFQRVSLSDIVTTAVPIEIIGESAGARDGGVMEMMMDELEIKSRADQIPTKIDVDVANLQIGHYLQASDIPLPEGAELATKPDMIVVTVKAAHMHDEPEVETAEEQGETAPPAE
ncbi:MAG: 50S ribosomal protein L25 [Armatimonadota bacterium]